MLFRSVSQFLPYDEPVTESGTASRYLRYPHLRGDLLTFIADDDVWLAPADGGRAWRISADQAAAAYPRLSPDGNLIAWTSWRDGVPEIYLAATGEGGSQRVTYWSSHGTQMRGWGPAGEILATTDASQQSRQAWAHVIPVTAGTAAFAGERQMAFGPVDDIAIDSNSIALLTGAIKDPAFWKGYRGGTAGRIWVAPAAAAAPQSQAAEGGSGPAFRRILADLPGQFSAPMLVAGRLAFVSDYEGTGNVYSCALGGTDLRRHTDHDSFYARNASTDGSRIVYQVAGDIWLLGDLTPDSEPVKLGIRLGSPASGLKPRLVSAEDDLDYLCTDQTGRASAVQVRGTVHWLTHKDGPGRALAAVTGPPRRLPQVLGATGKVAWVVDDGGADALEIGSVDGAGAGTGRIASGEIGWVADLTAAPDGSVVAIAAQDGRLLVVDVASAQVTELARSDHGLITGLTFAPDSGWLAWSQASQGRQRRIRLARLADRLIANVTDGRFIDTDPAFTADGQYLAFLSVRSFDPVHDPLVFDLAFPYGSRPYLVTLRASAPAPLGPFLDGRPAGAAKDEEKDGDAPAGRRAGASEAKPGGEPPAVVIDLDGLGERIVTVPVPDSKYASLRAVEDGLAWLKVPLTGELGDGGATPDDDLPRASLEYFDIKKSKCSELFGEADWFDVSGDGSKVVVGDRHRVYVAPANRKADSDNSEDKICVDLSRARFMADPVALWQAAYAEAGRAIRHDFWVPDLAGIDWDGVLGQYRPLLGKISTPDDFADVLAEVLGELGTSHAYVQGHDRRHLQGQGTGLLGADLEPAADGWRIRRVLPAESSDPRARSPLAAPGAGLAAGDLIVAIDGQPVDRATGPGPLLVGMAGKPVDLSVIRAMDGKPHRAVVVPLSSERRLRYLDWVSGRRSLTRELSGGRVGYLHVPDMQSEGWSDFHRDMGTEMPKEALIVDVRANRGGHTSGLVLEKLTRKIIAWEVSPTYQPESYPSEAPKGPVLVIADEYSGSDGDIITGAVKVMGVGPVVGARTWGGVLGISGWRELVDGTHFTVPQFGFWFADHGWDVENYGIDPDVEVLITPDDWAAGRDTQLEAAVTMALEALETRPAAQPPTTTDRPSKRRPALPPRPERRN